MIPCNRCGVPVPQPRYSVATDRMCPACQDELREYQRNPPVDDLGFKSEARKRLLVNAHVACPNSPWPSSPLVIQSFPR